MLRSVAPPLFVVLLAGAALADGVSCTVGDAGASSQAVWLLCQEGKVLVGDQSGAEWKEHVLPVEVELRAITLLGPRRALVAGDEGTVMTTEDSGVSWRRIPLSTRENLTAIHSVGESVWVTGWGGEILH